MMLTVIFILIALFCGACDGRNKYCSSVEKNVESSPWITVRLLTLSLVLCFVAVRTTGVLIFVKIFDDSIEFA